MPTTSTTPAMRAVNDALAASAAGARPDPRPGARNDGFGAVRSPDIIMVAAPPPVVLAYGVGVDSTALLCGESIISYGAGG